MVDRRRDLVDVFEALETDCPNQRFDPEDAGVRSGGHRGTTWHSWQGPEWACMISSVMAKAGNNAKHKCQLTHEDKAELEADEFQTGRRKKNDVHPRWGPQPPPAAEGRGGGYSGKIGGRLVQKSQRLGAAGHQRHIDHVYVAKGDGVREDQRGDVQPRVRVVRCRVVTASSSEATRRPGESRCACGAAAAAVARGVPPWSAAVIAKCTCCMDGVWGSDHFPVSADLRVSWCAAEGRPRSRDALKDQMHSPDRRGRRGGGDMWWDSQETE